MNTRLVAGTALIVLLALTAGCVQSVPSAARAAPPGGTIIGGLVINNRTADAFTEVRLMVVATREFVACGYIPARGHCATTFPLRQYQGNEIQVLWTRSGRPRGTPAFIVALPVPAPEGVPQDVVISIDGNDRVSALMRPS